MRETEKKVHPLSQTHTSQDRRTQRGHLCDTLGIRINEVATTLRLERRDQAEAAREGAAVSPALHVRTAACAS